MSNAMYSEEQKQLLIESLQATIQECKKKIEIAVGTIRQLNEDGNEGKINPFNKFEIVKKTRTGGSDWFSKIVLVLSNSTKALTSREILDRIYDEFPDFEKDSTHMGSLSSALRTKSESKELKKEKSNGEFARFSLPDKDLL